MMVIWVMGDVGLLLEIRKSADTNTVVVVVVVVVERFT